MNGGRKSAGAAGGSKFDPLLLGNAALPPSLSFEAAAAALGGSGGMKRAISMESLLSSVRSEAAHAGAATTGRPLSRGRPNNNSFRRAVDPSYKVGPQDLRGPAPQPPRKGPGPPGAANASKEGGSFFKNLFRRGGAAPVPAKAAPLPPPPGPASLPTTPVTAAPPGGPFTAPARQPAPPPPPPPPRAVNYPQPVPVADNTISSVESRVLQWQRQNAAAMQQQQAAAAAAAAAFQSTPKRAPPVPPPVNYELRGPPPMVSASVQPAAPPVPPPPNSRMRR